MRAWNLLPGCLAVAALVLASCQSNPPPNLDPPTAEALAAPAPALSRTVRPGAPRPNIILIVADDLGYGHLGAYGQKIISTPRLDAMAREGMRFTAAYSGSSVCAPSRAALMTGRHTGHTTIKKNMGGVRPGGFLLPRDVTVAEVLKAVGYDTAVIGKWGMGEPFTPGAPNRKGFDYFYGVTNQVDAHRHYPDYMLRNGERIEVPQNAGGNRQIYGDDLYTQEAVDYVSADRSNPFFLYLAFVAPHAEMTAPEESMAPYVDRVPRRPYINTEFLFDKTKNYASVAHPLAAQAGIVSRLDASVGHVLDALAEKGVDRETLVIFTSDNGPSDEGGASVAYFAATGPFRGGKRHLYEGGIRVPMIVRWPERVLPAVNDTPVAFWDLLATLADLAGAQAPAPVDGVSLAPVLQGGALAGERCLYWRYRPKDVLLQAARTGRWKALREGDGNLALFDLDADPAETSDLSAGNPAIVERLAECMREGES